VTKQDVVAALQGHEAGVGDQCGQLATLIKADPLVVAGMQHQGWRGDLRQQRPHVDVTKGILKTDGIFGAGRQALELMWR
jgi:hypothetical protein